MRSLLAAVSLAAMLSTAAVANAAPAPEMKTVKVNYDVRSIATDRGASSLRHRVEHAIVGVCGQYTGYDNLDRTITSCRDEVANAVRPQVENAIAAARNGAVLASNNGTISFKTAVAAS